MVAFQEGLGFTQKDAENLERVKEAMADLATGKGLLGTPDAAAAAAFAGLLDAETRRQELTLRGVEKSSMAKTRPCRTGWKRQAHRNPQIGHPELRRKVFIWVSHAKTKPWCQVEAER